ncbi:MAG TPA: hypothetical protein VF505_00400, partial [Thermoanaerobaculia bacterium]
MLNRVSTRFAALALHLHEPAELNVLLPPTHLDVGLSRNDFEAEVAAELFVFLFELPRANNPHVIPSVS